MLRETRIVMGMPATIVILDEWATQKSVESVFDALVRVDERFSPYKSDSEVSRINRGEIAENEQSPQMQEILLLAEKTRSDTHGYFNILRPDRSLDPSGIVKGWAIRDAALFLSQIGYENFYVDVGGDIQSCGKNAQGQEWRVGVRSPFHPDEIVKVLYPKGAGVATSGIYTQGQHIYDPYGRGTKSGEIVSLTIIGPDVMEADRYATAAFAMGRDGIAFIEQLPGFEAYEIDAFGVARMTSGLAEYLTC